MSKCLGWPYVRYGAGVCVGGVYFGGIKVGRCAGWEEDVYASLML